MISRTKKRYSILFAIFIAFLLFYIISPYIVTNKILESIVKKDVSTFSFFLDEEKLRENTKEVLLRELNKQVPDSIADSKATQYLASKAIEASLEKSLRPAFIVNMLSSTMFQAKGMQVHANYTYNIISPNTFIWNIKYDNSENDFQVTLKRHTLFIWKIEKIDFKV
jgi:hypothetical protein